MRYAAEERWGATRHREQSWQRLSSTVLLGYLAHESYVVPVSCCFFFFQAEDGIRDYKVTGVQTCALPIYIEGLRQRSADGSGALQDRAEGVELSRGPMGEVGKSAVADLAASLRY